MKNKIHSHLLTCFFLVLISCSGKINESNTANVAGKAELVQGGIVVYEANGHGLIVATSDLGKQDWENAMRVCEELELNGYSDWRLPTREELDILYTILKLKGIGDFEDVSYWSSSELNSYYAYRQNFKTGRTDRQGNKSKQQFVRAVRVF
jgi:uncharacterized protein DUF1566